MYYSIHKQTGVALLTAMLVVAIASIAAIAMTSRQRLDIRRTENILHTEQAFLFVFAGEMFAKDRLKVDFDEDKKSGNLIDSLDEHWANPIQGQVDDVQLSGHLEDLQGKFNLNNLSPPSSGTNPPSGTGASTGATGTGTNTTQQAALELKYFEDLLRTLDIPAHIAQAVADWIDPDTNSRFPDGAEDIEYLNQTTPYRTGNTKMANPSELRMVKGVDNVIYKKLIPFVTALPDNTKINVNTAPAEIIAAMSPNINIADAENIIQDRPFTDKNVFIALLKLPQQQQSIADLIDLKTNYFMLHSNIELGKKQLKHYSILERIKTGEIYVIGRERGTY